MMLTRVPNKIWIVAAVLTLAFFAGIFLHQHFDEHAHDCAACRFIAQMLVLLPAVLFLLAALERRVLRFVPVVLLPFSRVAPAAPKTGPPALF